MDFFPTEWLSKPRVGKNNFPMDDERRIPVTVFPHDSLSRCGENKSYHNWQSHEWYNFFTTNAKP